MEVKFTISYSGDPEETKRVAAEYGLGFSQVVRHTKLPPRYEATIARVVFSGEGHPLDAMNAWYLTDGRLTFYSQDN